jgi:L-rhamnose-H+ transport protein
MSPEVAGGFALILLAGLLSGNCMLPMKFARRWAWENTWLVFTLVSLVVLPWGCAWLAAGDPMRVYRSLPAESLALPFWFGLGWGIAQVLFGLSIARLGLALGYAIIIGLGSLGGTLVPLFFQQRAVLHSGRGLLIGAGLAVMVAGIAVSARAGRQREAGAASSGSTYLLALGMAVLCGLMAPMINYSFAWGQPIAARAVEMGVAPALASYVVWPVGLTGGLLPNLAYCFWLLGRNRTWGRFGGPWLPDAALGAAMAVLWMGAMSAYGTASGFLGDLGTSVGWGIFQILMIITANTAGVLTGEWRQAPAGARRTLYGGLALLALATVLLAAGNSR